MINRKSELDVSASIRQIRFDECIVFSGCSDAMPRRDNDKTWPANIVETSSLLTAAVFIMINFQLKTKNILSCKLFLASKI